MNTFHLSMFQKLKNFILLSIVFCLTIMDVNAQEQKYDLIIKKDGSKIEAIVQYVELDVVKYKNFNNFDGPLYTISKGDIVTIVYANGTVDVFQKNVHASTSNNDTVEQKIGNYAELKIDYNRALKLKKSGNCLWISGLTCTSLGIIFFGVGMGQTLHGLNVSPSIVYFGAALIPIGMILIIPGAIMSGIGNSKVRRINNEMIEFCSLPLNKGSKYSVNLSFTSNGLALRF